VDVGSNRFLAPASMTEEVKAALREENKPLPKGEHDLFRCITQSLAVCYAQAIRDLEKLTKKTFTSLNIVGGGSNNAVLNQWTAKATGLPVYAGPAEGTALGNCIAQLIALGEIPDLPTARQMIRKDFDIQEYLP